MSLDALQPGGQSKTPSQKVKKQKKKNNNYSNQDTVVLLAKESINRMMEQKRPKIDPHKYSQLIS